MTSTNPPDGWNVEPLGSCVDVLDRLRKPVNGKERESRHGSVPYYGATGRVGWIDEPLFNEELILLGEDGAPFLDKSKPIAYLIDGPSWVNNHAHVLRARGSVTTNRYMKHYLDSFDYTDFVQGSTRDKLNQGAMKEIPVLLPPLDVQNQIVQLIEEVEKSRASAASHLAAARLTIERFRQAVLAAACSGRLTADWRGQNTEPSSVVQVLSELRSKRKERKQREQAVSLLLPELPETYVIASLGECAVMLEYGTSQKCVTDSTSGVPVLRMGNIQHGQLDFGDLKYCSVDGEIIRLMLEPGDLLFNRTNSPELVGKSAVYQSDVPASFASYLIRVRFDNRAALPEFVNYWLNSAWGRAWAQLAKTDGVSQSNINGSKLALMPVLLPPIDEQGVIVERVSRMLMVADAIHARVESASSAVDKSSQAVLAKAFRGQLALAAPV